VMGVSRSAVAQWKTVRAGQISANWTRIAEGLKVSVEYMLYGKDRLTTALAAGAEELALLRLYRQCVPEDRQILLRTARRLARSMTARRRR